MGEQFLERLKRISRFQTKTKRLQGQGSVQVEIADNGSISFQERGAWQNGLSFTNRLRWISREGKISLEHLRFGENDPVFLLHFVPSRDGQLNTLTPHHCNLDTYTARIEWNEKQIKLSWEVCGPQKDEKIEIIYQ